MTIKEELQNVKEMIGAILQCDLAPNSYSKEMQDKINRGHQSLVRLEELIEELDPEGIK
jgi:hypothetical protein